MTPSWHRHGWNRPLAWELILRITPRVPRWLMTPLQHLTTLLCFSCMHRERAAARRNLGRVTGCSAPRSLALAYRLFYNFSRYMVAYAEMRRQRIGEFRERLLGADEAEATIRDLLNEGRGLVLATMHLGQWDLGLKLMEQFEVPVHVVMVRGEADEVTRYADDSRAWAGLVVHPMGRSPMLAITLMAALKRGEIVAIQIDRPIGDNIMGVELFGAETDLPTGPVQLAMATGAPLLPIFMLLDRGRCYRVLALPPLRLERQRDEQAAVALKDAMSRIGKIIESVVSRFPDQWFNFYDVWPRRSSRDARA